MASSTDSGSSTGRAPRSKSPWRSSRSRERSATPAPEPSASRLLFEPRRDLAVPIAVEVFRRDGEGALEYATNLSPSGVCLHARLRFTVGEGVTVAFALPGEDGRIRARGRVTWREDDDPKSEACFLETGVRFEVVDETDRERITRFVRELERE
jgi:uncharacterized protein (TIGR02266 family)